MRVVEYDIAKIKPGKRFRKDMGDLDELAETIKKDGLLQPILIWQDGTLVAGGRRLAACQKLGWKKITVVIRPTGEMLNLRELELLENIARKDLTWHERAALERDIYELHIKKDPSWSFSKQADLTDASKAAISRRIELAKAVDIVPELKSADHEAGAWKIYSRMKEDVVINALANKAKDEFKEVDKYANTHYMIGDAFAGMAKLAHGVHNFAEVDPPYAIELDKRKARNKRDTTKAYREVSEEDYGKFTKDMARLVFHALRQNSFTVWWHAAEWAEIVKEILEEVGFSVAPIPAIWYKGQAGQTASPDTMLASSYEPFFVCRKGMPKLHKAGRSNVFEFEPVSPLKKIHPTERPIELMEELLDTFCYPGYSVISPFLGSGSILRACYKKQMVGFGWDLDDTTKHRFLGRVRADQMNREEPLPLPEPETKGKKK